MIVQILKTALISLAIGFLVEITSHALGSNYLQDFFKANLITILIALLAINLTTMGIVLTKIRDLIDQHSGLEKFTKTRAHMMLSVKEQIGLVLFAACLLTVKESTAMANIANISLLINSLVTGVFAYALLILYDTAKGVFIIVDYDNL